MSDTIKLLEVLRARGGESLIAAAERVVAERDRLRATPVGEALDLIAGLEAQVQDLEADLAHIRGQRSELAGLLAEVTSEMNRLEVE